MSLRPYLQLALRWRLLWGLTYPLQTLYFFILPKYEGIHFVGGHLLLPFATGLMINQVVVEVLHRPFSFLLPGMRRFFWRAQALTILLAAGPLVWVAHWRSPEFPLLASLGVVLGSVSMAMPWTANLKWCGSHRLALLWFAVIGLCAWRYQEVFAFAKFCPLLVGAGGLGAAFGCFALAFNRRRMRTQAMEYYLAPESALFDAHSKSARRRYMQRESLISGRDWPRASIGGSMRSWMAAIRFETLGVIKRPWLFSLNIGGFLLMTMLLVSFVPPALEARGIPTLQAGFAQLHASFFGESSRFAVWFTFGMFYVVMLGQTNFPRPKKLYPLSRRRMARMALLIGLRQFVLAVIGVVIISFCLAWIVCWLADKPFTFVQAPVFSFPLLALPALPLVLWSMLTGSQDGLMVSPSSVAMIMAIGVGLMSAVCLALNLGFTPYGLGYATAATLVTGLYFVRSVRKFYLHSDLVRRAST